MQHALLSMLEHVKNGRLSIERLVEKMCHNPAILFRVRDRGFIREGYYADLVVVDPKKEHKVTKENILYKCGWSPFEDVRFSHSVYCTFVNGLLVYRNGAVLETESGHRLTFEEE